ADGRARRVVAQAVDDRARRRPPVDRLRHASRAVEAELERERVAPAAVEQTLLGEAEVTVRVELRRVERPDLAGDACERSGLVAAAMRPLGQTDGGQRDERDGDAGDEDARARQRTRRED